MTQGLLLVMALIAGRGPDTFEFRRSLRRRWVRCLNQFESYRSIQRVGPSRRRMEAEIT
jgi:hypothetical protein